MYLSMFGFFVRSLVCLCVCLRAYRSACMYSENRRDIDPHGAPSRCKSDPKIDPWTPKVAPKSTPRRPTSLQNRSLGVLRGALGRSRHDVRHGRVQRSTGDLKKSTFGTSKGPKGAKRAPKEIYRADPAPPRTPLGRFLAPQNAERKK